MFKALAQRRITRQAGSSAAREYQRLTKEWRARNRRRFLILGAADVVVYLVTFLPSRHHLFVYVAGFLAGP